MIRRRLAWLVLAALSASGLAACSGSSDYCVAAEKHESALRDFGGTRSNAAFEGYLVTARAMEKSAPDEIVSSWKPVRTSIARVLKAQKSSNPLLALEDMDDPAKVNGLGTAEMGKLNDAYTAFNKTADAREAIVTNLATACDLDLRPANDD